jgi:hypothetical protein
LFVTSKNALHIKSDPECKPNATTIFKSKPSYGDEDLDSDKIDPFDITKGTPFLYDAWNNVLDLAEKNKNVTATIYLSRGTHFLFNCAPKKE